MIYNLLFFPDSIKAVMVSSESLEERPDLTVTPRSRREQLIEVVDNYKEKLRQIKGQVSAIFGAINCIKISHILSGFPHDGRS